jgi:equilibrative nucleoside transporter 1/2/3
MGDIRLTGMAKLADDNKSEESDGFLSVANNDKKLKDQNEMILVVGNKDDKMQELEQLDEEQSRTPRDCYLAVFLIFVLHGIAVLMPWNMFITANDYFVHYKLAPVNSNSSSVESGEMTTYQKYFLSSLCFVANVPNVALNGLNLFCQFKSGSTVVRIIFGIISVIVVFLFTVVLAILDSSQWQGVFFWVTMISVVLINSANGIYQNNVYKLAACLPMKYTSAVIIGSNTCGVPTVIIVIISQVVAPNPRVSAICFFMAAVLILLMALGSLYLLKRMDFYKYYSMKAKQQQLLASQSETSEHYFKQYVDVFKQTWREDCCIFFVFFVTLSCFPTILADIRQSSDSFFISKDFYSLFMCFVIFNVFIMIGSLFSIVCQQPGPKWLWLPVVSRVIFIPFFVMCNFRPEARRLPVWFANDYVYAIGGVLMALTNGYFSSLSMMFAPSRVESPEQKGIAGMMAAFCLILGILCGVLFTFPIIFFVENVGSHQLHFNSTANGLP